MSLAIHAFHFALCDNFKGMNVGISASEAHSLNESKRTGQPGEFASLSGGHFAFDAFVQTTVEQSAKDYNKHK